MKSRLTDSQKIDIVNKYSSGDYSLTRIAKEYNFTLNGIKGCLKRRGIEIKSDRAECQRLYYLNQHYFDIIDTEHKAYWLGFLYADGCNYEKKNRIHFHLQECDKLILEKFLTDLESNIPLRFIKRKNPKWKDMYAIDISSKQISKQLSLLGCFNKKSLILKFPTEEQVPKYLLNHFLRGMWDGDGCISKYYDKKLKVFRTHLVSTLDFCESTQIILNTIDIVSSIKQSKDSIKRNTTTRNLKISGSLQTLRFLRWLYKDATIYLDRKYLLYNELKNMRESK